MKGKKKSSITNSGRGGGDSKAWFLPRHLNPNVPNDKWSDSEFILASDSLKDLELMDKIEFIYGHSKAIGLFGLIVREIDGKSYEYGLELKNYLISQSVGWFYVEHEKQNMFEYFKQNFLVRFAKCQEVEKHTFINYQLEQIRNLYILSKADKPNVKYNGLAYGYFSELSKDYSWLFFEVINGAYPHMKIDIKKTQFNYPYCLQVALGAAYYKMEVWLLNLSKEFSTDNTSFLGGSKISHDNIKTRSVSFSCFKDIFISSENYYQAIKALVTIQAIDENKNNQIKTKLKGTVSVLIQLLETKQYLQHISDSDLVPLLNIEFIGLNMGEKSDGKTLRNFRKEDAAIRTKLKALIK